MSISNDQELVKAVAQAGSLLQEIHDYCGRSLRDDSKVNFPRGMIGTAASYRGRCPGYLTADQISSCAYGFMYLDVLWWLLSRTDIASVGKQMAIKSAIVTLGTLLEATLWIPGLPISNALSTKSPCGVKVRLKDTTKQGWISQEQCTTLETLWGHRNNVHIKFLENSELAFYKIEHVNAPLGALLVLMSKLKALHAEQQQRREPPVVAGRS
jgi:hypothetical protein